MKRIPLSDPIFSELINGSITRRAIVNELLSTREVFQHPIQAWFSRTQNIIISILLIIMAALSAYTIASWTTGEKQYKAAIHDIYSGDKTQVEENKQKAFEKEGLK